MTAYTASYSVPADAFPIGEHLRIDIDGGEYLTTYVAGPVLYCLVSLDGPDVPDRALLADLERVRGVVADMAGIHPSPAIPKLAIVSADRDGAHLYFRTRLANGQPWHPGVAGTGLLALGAALTSKETTASLVGGMLVDVKRVGTPAGVREIVRDDCDGIVRVRISVAILPFDVEDGVH